MRFSANLGFLWADLPLPQAIRAAAAAGFDAVECHWPYDADPAEVAAALRDTGLPMLGLNTLRGALGENGLSALPGREAEARAGAASIPDVEVRAYLSPGEFRSKVEQARVVVSHGGAGAIGTALRAGRRPIVMARLRCHGEHVDDHQLDLVDKLRRLGLVVPIERTITADDVASTADVVAAPPELSALPSVLDEVRRLLGSSSLH